MWSPYRKKHLKILLEISLKKRNSLDTIAHKYFRDNRSLGSKDRLWLKKGLYDIIKWKEVFIAHKATSADEIVDLYTSPDNPMEKDLSHLPSHVQVSFPKWLFKKIDSYLGYEKALAYCKLSNEQAPITIRVNTNKTDVNTFFDKHEETLGLTKCKKAKAGFHLKKNFKFDTIADFKEGHFEPQDEASQLIAEFVNAKPGEHILDFCAASGGKTLAFAPDMKNKGQIHLHDIREKPLFDAKKRLKKAGIENFQIYHDNEKRLSRLLNAMNVVLVDAPCSCSGTFRRRPDHKWMLTEESLQSVIDTQRDILKQAEKFVKPSGLLIYATCSILKEENQDQTAFFKETSNLNFVSEHFIPLTRGGSDAMYISIFKKNSLV
ncbi:MAG: Ribosomal RNA small subunit methyltransferase B [Chlamydiia bacterium]|nr:Ribosomal RNA small subunit methyltransferase B [Chlamydiia bacterium]